MNLEMGRLSRMKQIGLINALKMENFLSYFQRDVTTEGSETHDMSKT
jgi:hypothetical protein